MLPAQCLFVGKKFAITSANPDLQIRGGDHLDPEIRGVASKKFFFDSSDLILV